MADNNEQNNAGVPLNPDIEATEVAGNASTSASMALGNENLQLADSTGISSYIDKGYGVDPNGDAQIKFEFGNFDKIQYLTKPLDNKIILVQKTIIPIIEVALIELLGNNSLYQAKTFNATAELDTKGNSKVEVDCSYFVEKFIGTDVDKNSIMHDAKYILDRVNGLVQNISWNKCEIDCTQGMVTINFFI